MLVRQVPAFLYLSSLRITLACHVRLSVRCQLRGLQRKLKQNTAHPSQKCRQTVGLSVAPKSIPGGPRRAADVAGGGWGSCCVRIPRRAISGPVDRFLLPHGSRSHDGRRHGSGSLSASLSVSGAIHCDGTVFDVVVSNCPQSGQ